MPRFARRYRMDAWRRLTAVAGRRARGKSTMHQLYEGWTEPLTAASAKTSYDKCRRCKKYKQEIWEDSNCISSFTELVETTTRIIVRVSNSNFFVRFIEIKILATQSQAIPIEVPSLFSTLIRWGFFTFFVLNCYCEFKTYRNIVSFKKDTIPEQIRSLKYIYRKGEDPVKYFYLQIYYQTHINFSIFILLFGKFLLY